MGPAIGLATLVGAPPAAWSARALLAASTSASLVATTTGRDLAHVMDAVAHLRAGFRALAIALAFDALVVAAVVTMLLPRSP
ncbi:MAG: hypothetical protein U0325_11165 [Polyangiales bacterium]